LSHRAGPACRKLNVAIRGGGGGTEVPTPGTLGLFGLSLLLLAGARRRLFGG
jgi:hypothetical protein